MAEGEKTGCSCGDDIDEVDDRLGKWFKRLEKRVARLEEKRLEYHPEEHPN